MRRLLLAIVCLSVWAAGCDSPPTDSGQDREKAKKRPMMKPGSRPGDGPQPVQQQPG